MFLNAYIFCCVKFGPAFEHKRICVDARAGIAAIPLASEAGSVNELHDMAIELWQSTISRWRASCPRMLREHYKFDNQSIDKVMD